jgi:hypothetical protein
MKAFSPVAETVVVIWSIQLKICAISDSWLSNATQAGVLPAWSEGSREAAVDAGAVRSVITRHPESPRNPNGHGGRLCYRLLIGLQSEDDQCGFLPGTAFSARYAPGQGRGEAGQPVDQDRIMVRARVRGHLEALKKRFPDLLGQCDVQTFAGSDYAFPIFIAKPVWCHSFAELGQESNYDNFKSEVAHHQGPAGTAYEHALHDVWSVMYRLQE